MLKKVKEYFKDTPRNFKEKELSYGIKNIPPGAIILTRSKRGIFQYLIRKSGNAWTDHAVLYFGSGKHEIVEALTKVRTGRLEEYLTKDHQFEIYAKRNLTVEQLLAIKGYTYGSIGKEYDVQGVLGFVFGNKDENNKNFCSELVAESFEQAQLKVSNKEASKTSPEDIREYLKSMEAFKAGWILWDSYNC